MNQTSSERPLRVLHITTMLRSGGVERWLVDLCYVGRSHNLSMDIAVLHRVEGLFAQRARELGITVIECPGEGRPIRFVKNLRRILREHGPYDAIDAHLHAFSGFAVLAARLEGVPARVVHSHNVMGNSSGSILRRSYGAFARALIRRFATVGLAPSVVSMEDLLGPHWRKDPKFRIMPYGIDLSPFRDPLPDTLSRSAFGLPEHAFVLASVGRLTWEKNSEFLVDILAATLRRNPNAYLLLIGEGPLRNRLLEKAALGKFSDHLLLPGTRADVPAILRSIVDAFVFPSPPPPRGTEALGIAVVEAQAAGIKTVISDGIPHEAIIVPELVTQIRADAGAERWAEVIIELAAKAQPLVSGAAFAAVERSEFNCVHSLKALGDIYRDSGRVAT